MLTSFQVYSCAILIPIKKNSKLAQAIGNLHNGDGVIILTSFQVCLCAILIPLKKKNSKLAQAMGNLHNGNI